MKLALLDYVSMGYDFPSVPLRCLYWRKNTDIDNTSIIFEIITLAFFDEKAEK